VPFKRLKSLSLTVQGDFGHVFQSLSRQSAHLKWYLTGVLSPSSGHLRRNDTRHRWWRKGCEHWRGVWYWKETIPVVGLWQWERLWKKTVKKAFRGHQCSVLFDWNRRERMRRKSKGTEY
jgi:hypothetical protein